MRRCSTVHGVLKVGAQLSVGYIAAGGGLWILKRENSRTKLYALKIYMPIEIIDDIKVRFTGNFRNMGKLNRKP